jgi:hypothetical protein
VFGHSGGRRVCRTGNAKFQGVSERCAVSGCSLGTLFAIGIVDHAVQWPCVSQPPLWVDPRDVPNEWVCIFLVGTAGQPRLATLLR